MVISLSVEVDSFFLFLVEVDGDIFLVKVYGEVFSVDVDVEVFLTKGFPISKAAASSVYANADVLVKISTQLSFKTIMCF